MKIDIRPLTGASLITISGRIDSDTSPEVAAAFQSVQDKDVYRIIVDMAGLEYISSATLRALMTAQRISKRTGRGEVILLRVPEKIYSVLDMAGLADLFQIVSDPSTLPELAGLEQASADPGPSAAA